MLTDTTIRNAHKSVKAKLGKPFKLSDERGLYLKLTPNKDGWSKWWRLKYRIEGKEKSLSFGVYPDVSLEQARLKREDARKLIAQGIDPSNVRQEERQVQIKETTHTLNAVTQDWLEKKMQIPFT